MERETDFEQEERRRTIREFFVILAVILVAILAFTRFKPNRSEAIAKGAPIISSIP